MAHRKVFIDTGFIVALINRNDQYHKEAFALSEQYENTSLITTEAILLEIGNALSKNYKQEAIRIIETFRSSDEVEIVELSREVFEEGFKVYKTYADKKWGMVDCISFAVMWENKVEDVLTFDAHFEQAGFTLLSMKKTT